MWTHKRPFRGILSSKRRIQYHGKTELFRALHKKRLIAFVGSGLTMPYGRLSWGELSKLLVMEVDYAFWEAWTGKNRKEGFRASEAKHLHRSLRTIVVSDSDIGGGPDYRGYYNFVTTVPNNICLTVADKLQADTSLLELCSELAMEIGCPNLLKEKCAEYFMQGPLKQFENRLMLIEGKGDKSLYGLWKKIADRHDAIMDLKPTDSEVNQCAKDWIKEGNWNDEKRPSFLRCALEEKPWEMLLEAGSPKAKRRKTLKRIYWVLGHASKPGAKIVPGNWPDPVKAVVNDLNVRRMVTVNYDTELERYFLHSHGHRLDGKNDHLVTSHSDLQGAEPSRVANRINGFGVKLKSVTLSRTMIGKMVDFAALSSHYDSYVFHLHGRADFPKDLILSEKDYQNLYVRTSKLRTAFGEGMNVLLGGNDLLFLGVGMSEADLNQPLRQFISESRHVSLRPDGIVALLNHKEKASDTERRSVDFFSRLGVKTLVYDAGTDDVEGKIKEKQEEYSKKLKANTKRHCLLELMILSRQKVKVQSEALEEQIIDLAKQRKDWWKDWNEPPGKRKAVFKNFSEQNGDTAPIVWIRQKIKHQQDSQVDHYKAECESFASLVTSLSQFSKKRRIRRFATNVGGGKGAFVHALQQTVLKKGELSETGYSGCFFADARFSTEFNSVISALSRFLALLIGRNKNLKADELDDLVFSAFKQDYVSGLFPKLEIGIGRISILENYFAYYAKAFGVKIQSGRVNENRILICLSGLDRLVNEDGYAHNALHRAFFKALTNPSLKCAPIDLVLVAGKPDCPIRYLSEPEDKGKPWDDQDCKLDTWELITPTYQTNTKDCPIIERKWLPNWKSDKELGINCDQNLKPKREHLANVAAENVSVHIWLRAIPKALKKAGLSKKSDRCKYYDTLELAASRDGRQGVVATILDLYQDIDTTGEKLDLGVFQIILRHLALFSVPIERSVLASCPDIQKSILKSHDLKTDTDEKGISEQLQEYLTKLQQHGLVVKLEGGRKPESPGEILFKEHQDNEYRYTLHSLMRQQLARRMKFGPRISGESSFFDISLAAAQPLDLPSPRESDFELIGKILERFVIDMRDGLSSAYELERLDKTCSADKAGELLSSHFNEVFDRFSTLDSPQSFCRRVRAAVSLMNGTFSVGVVSRLESVSEEMADLCGSSQPFECYRGWLRGILNVAIALKKQEKTVRFVGIRGDEETRDKVIKKDTATLNELTRQWEYESGKNGLWFPPLYQTEIAWLYNERAVVSLIQGRLFDALPLFKLAVSSLEAIPWNDPQTLRTTEAQTSLRRARLNEAIALLEHGELDQAEKTFERLYQRKMRGDRNRRSLTAHIACGYLGLIHHLRGRKVRAKRLYKETLEYLQTEDTNHLRAVSIFRQHLGNLFRSQGKYDKAETYLDLSIKAASSSRHLDIYHHARISRAKLLLTRDQAGDMAECFGILRDARSYAEKMGVMKIKAHAEIVRGEVLLQQGQLPSAGKAITSALAISNKHGLRLMKIAALKLYDQLLQRRDTKEELIEDVQEAAKKLREKTGYMLHG